MLRLQAYRAINQYEMKNQSTSYPLHFRIQMVSDQRQRIYLVAITLSSLVGKTTIDTSSTMLGAGEFQTIWLIQFRLTSAERGGFKPGTRG